MKEISLTKKLKVITMFFSGNTYDEIVTEVGISKGSVVNTVEDFKAGKLPIAPNEYIDALRELAVDLRKQHTTVKSLKMYVAIDQKLAEMGVGIEEVDDWLDIVEDLATETVSMKNFVSTVLEMSCIEMETGLNATSLVAEYKNTSQALNNLKAEMANTTELKEKADAELDAINKAMAAAREQHDTQTAELKGKLDAFMAQNHLSWNKVNTVIAILEGEFSKEGLSEEETGIISKCIADTASLVSYNKVLRKEKKDLEEYIPVLKEDAHNLEMSNIGLLKHNDQLASHVYAMMQEEKALDKQVKETKWQLSELKSIKYHNALDIYTGWLILAFLQNPEAMSEYDFDQLVEIMNGIRMARLGQQPKQVIDAKGKVICQCEVPMPYTPFTDYGVAREDARERLAGYLMLLVSDKFVPKFEYETTKMMQEINDMNKQLVNALSGHPGAPDQPADQVGTSEQKMTPEETNFEEKEDEAVDTDATIMEQLAPKETCIDYYSPKAIKARWEADKKFSALVGPRTCNTPYLWKCD